MVNTAGEAGVKALLAGWIDVFIGGREAGVHFLVDNGSVDSREYFIIVSCLLHVMSKLLGEFGNQIGKLGGFKNDENGFRFSSVVQSFPKQGQ